MWRGSVRVGLLTTLCAIGYSQSLGSIEGRVLDAVSGQPLKGATLGLASRRPGGQRSAEVEADVSGHYRFSAVAAGEYTVWATKPGYGRNAFLVGRNSASKPITLGGGQELKGLDFALAKSGVITGCVWDAEHQPVAGAQVSAVASLNLTGRKWTRTVGASARANDRGEFRLFDLPQGRYYVKAVGPSRPIVFGPAAGDRKTPQTKKVDFLQTYYPGVDDFSEALLVTVVPGQETPGVDVRLLSGVSFVVSGRVQSPADAGGASFSIVWLEALDRPEAEGKNTVSNAAGGFRFVSVRPGTYRVSAYREVESGSLLSGAAETSVSDHDQEDLAITLAAAPDVLGRVRTEGGDPVPAEVARRIGVIMTLERQDPGMPRLEPGVLGEDGRFVIRSVPPGKYWVRLDGLRERYYVKAIRYGKQDILPGALFSLSPGATLEVEISSKAASIVATVKDAQGEPVPYAFVVAERDGKAIPNGADQRGVVRLDGMAPGPYRLYAFEGGDLSTARTLDLAPYSARATAVELDGGGANNVELHPIAAQP